MVPLRAGSRDFMGNKGKIESMNFLPVRGGGGGGGGGGGFPGKKRENIIN